MGLIDKFSTQVCFVLICCCVKQNSAEESRNSTNLFYTPKILGKCTKAEECVKAYEKAFCSKGRCYCDKGYRFSISAFKCIPNEAVDLFEKCTSDEQCLNTTANTICDINYFCNCAYPYFYSTITNNCTQTAPHKFPKRSCNESEQCHDNFSCLNGSCKCESWFYNNFKWICLRQKKLGESCNGISEICDEPSVTCMQGKCKCKSKISILSFDSCFPDKRLKLGSECLIDNQCQKNVKNSLCINRVCSCPLMYTAMGDKAMCKKNTFLGEECTGNDHCIDAYSECKEGICQCIYGTSKNGKFQCNSHDTKMKLKLCLIALTTLLFAVCVILCVYLVFYRKNRSR